MYTWILMLTSIGASIGAFSAQYRDGPTMIIMTLVGAIFCAPLGGLLFGLFAACQSVQKRKKSEPTGATEIEFEMASFQDRSANISQEWEEYRSAFPHYAVGDTDPVAKILTGWKDASDIAYQRDINS